MLFETDESFSTQHMYHHKENDSFLFDLSYDRQAFALNDDIHIELRFQLNIRSQVNTDPNDKRNRRDDHRSTKIKTNVELMTILSMNSLFTFFEQGFPHDFNFSSSSSVAHVNVLQAL